MKQAVRKILFIEDDPSIRTNIAELLTIKGYEVSTAANGKDGIHLAKSEKPNLILCDIFMPDMNGQQVLQEIRNTPAVSDVPFLFLTAQVDTVDLRHQMGLEASDYLAKPFQLKDLIQAINTQLDRYHQLESNNH